MSIPSFLESTAIQTISLLISDVKTWKLIGVNQEIMEAALKGLNIAPKVLMKMSNMCDISLAREEGAKNLARSFYNTK